MEMLTTLQDIDITSTNARVTIGLAAASAAVLMYYLYRRSNSDKYPDGPVAFPILGNIPQMIFAGGDLSVFLERNRRKYGNVFTIELGGVKRVMVSGYDATQYLLVANADHTSSRTADSMPKHLAAIAKATPGLFWAPYPQWKTVRSFALNVLREEGMGKTSMDARILLEIDQYINHFIEPNLGTPIDMTHSLTYATSNIISQMIIGKRFDYEDPDLHGLNSAFADDMKALMKASITKNIPFVKYLPGDLTGHNLLNEANEYIMRKLSEMIKQSHKNLDTDDQNNFVSQALLCARTEKEKGKKDIIFTDGNIAIVTLHLYMAGTETTATALKWALLYMILYPDIQDEVRREIQEVVGERQVLMKDKLSLPYTAAVLHEVWRCSNIAATIVHTLDTELTVVGKTIPAGADLMFNMASVVNDPEIFPGPNKFNPDRFLAPGNHELRSKMMAFGIGRRACLGEALARAEFFLFFTTFLQKYRVSSPPDNKPSIRSHVGNIRSPQKYDVIFEQCYQ